MMNMPGQKKIEKTAIEQPIASSWNLSLVIIILLFIFTFVFLLCSLTLPVGQFNGLRLRPSVYPVTPIFFLVVLGSRKKSV